MYSIGKKEFWTHCEFFTYYRVFGLKRGPEYLYWLFDVSPKQATCEMKTLQVQVYIQIWFHDEQGTKFL